MNRKSAILGLFFLLLLPLCLVSADYNTSINVNTNGFDSYVLVRVNASDVSAVNNLGGNITYTALDNTVVFLASDNQRYDVITDNPVNLTENIEITLENTMYIDEDFDGNGITYIRGAGIGVGDWIIAINGTNIVVENFRLNSMRYIDTVADLAITGTNITLRYVEIFNSSKYTFVAQGCDNLEMYRCKTDRGQYGFSGSGAQSYNGSIHDNYFRALSRNAIKVKGLTNYTFENNFCDLDPRNPDDATVIGIEMSRDRGSQDIYVYNNTFHRDEFNWTQNSWGLNANENPPLVGNNFSNVWFVDNIVANMQRAGWMDNGADYMEIHNNTVINCTLTFTDNDGGNSITGTVVHDKQYYNTNPPTAGAKGYPIRLINEYNAAGLGGEGKYYGLYPSIKTKIKIDVGWTEAEGVIVYVGGLRFKVYTFAGQVRILGYDQDATVIDCLDGDNVSRAYFEVEVDTRAHSGIFTWYGDEDEGALGLPLDVYYNKFDEDTANQFTEPHIDIIDVGASVGTMYGYQQYAYVPDFAGSIGSIRHQGLGFDGLRTWSELGMGLQDLATLGANCTVFWDTGYWGNGTYLTWVNTLNFELGAHFHPTAIDSLNNVDFEGNITQQLQWINGNCTGTVETYAILGTGWIYNVSRVQWMVNNQSLLQRANRVNVQLPNGAQLIDSAFPYLDNATVLGYAVAPLYTHETEITPPDAGSIDSALWDLWITHLHAGEGTKVQVVGYYEWYMINSNQQSDLEDSDFTYGSKVASESGWTGTINTVTTMTIIMGVLLSTISKVNFVP